MDASGSANGAMLYLHNGALIVAMKPNTAFTAWLIFGTANVADGNWHYISLVFNSSGACALYVDAAVDGTVTSGAWNFNSQVFRFGLGTDSFWQQYIGDIDEFRASDVNRSADWITTEYNNQSNPGNIGAAGFITYGSET